MGRCRYCGEDAGLLRREHRDCRIAHGQGRERINALVLKATRDGQVNEGLRREIGDIARESHIAAGDLRDLVSAGWSAAVEHALDDHVITGQEEANLHQLQTLFQLENHELDDEGALTRLKQACVLRDVLNGELPKLKIEGGPLPFNLMKSESLVWVFQEVDYFEEKTRTQFRGGSQGMSFRVAKGVYYRVGGFRGERVQTSEKVYGGTGLLGVTTRHLYFSGGNKHFRIRYDRMVVIEPYRDGIGVMRDAQSAKPQTFVTGDGWFVYNLVSNLAQA
ncbi:MAG: hypothetical protein OXG07_13550 [Anaerolineaceae bacterium]|nr:hypothetical protein [Anaerolineaceae bacterium]MCY3907424.1 hypothetical protein [Anaerolineaceae bacterium]